MLGGKIFDYMARYHFEKVTLCQQGEVGLRAIIAIHSTALGPATGGMRMWEYDSDEAALWDAMRLARGMTYKYAISGINLGGGKAVIIGNARTQKTEGLLKAMARHIQALAGQYYTGEDVGLSLDDMEVLRSETEYVVTLPADLGGMGAIAPMTALGVVRGMQAAARTAFGSDDLSGRTVAVQGVGAVGSELVAQLVAAGAQVTLTDIEPARAERVAKAHGARLVEPEQIYDQPVEVFAPAALGGIINDKTLPRLKCRVIAGPANNQLLEERHAEECTKRGILYAPDYAINAGGAIYDADRLGPGGGHPERGRRHVERIYDTIARIIDLAARDGVTTAQAADRLAEQRLATASAGRRVFPALVPYARS